MGRGAGGKPEPQKQNPGSARHPKRAALCPRQNQRVYPLRWQHAPEDWGTAENTHDLGCQVGGCSRTNPRKETCSQHMVEDQENTRSYHTVFYEASYLKKVLAYEDR